jgi:hypothetical protein
MKVIEITERKREKMSEHAEKMLRHAGKLMQCIEELGERDGMGERYDDDWDDDDDDDDYGRRDEDMGRRRGVKYTGRYSRYRRR